MDWSAVDYCDVFIRLSFWRHPFTAEHPLLRHWCRDTFLMKKHTQMNWGWTHSQCFWVNYSFKCSESVTCFTPAPLQMFLHQSEHTQRCRTAHIPVSQHNHAHKSSVSVMRRNHNPQSLHSQHHLCFLTEYRLTAHTVSPSLGFWRYASHQLVSTETQW